MRVLVTGANGFVGRAVCAHLSSLNHHVVAAVRANRLVIQAHRTFIVDSLSQDTDWHTVLQGVDAVIHLAARVHIVKDRHAQPLAEFRRINVAATLQLARQTAAAGVKRFVFLSTAKVNGEFSLPGQSFRESDVPNPQDAYGLSKYEAEQGLVQIAAATNMEVVIVRPPLVYGPGVKANFAALMNWVARGWPLPLGAVDNCRSLVAIDNLVEFVAICLTHPDAANQIFFVSDRQDLSTTALAHAIADVAGVRAHLLTVPVPLLMSLARILGKGPAAQRLCQNLQIDTTKAVTLLGWAPKVSVRQALKGTVLARGMA